MTLDALARSLARLRKFLLNKEISVEDYLKVFDLFSEIDSLKVAFEDLRLVLEVDDGQETVQSAFDFLVERASTARHAHGDDNFSMELSGPEFSSLVNCLRRAEGAE